MSKLCRKCNTLKSHNDFYKNAKRPDGLQTCCKTCHKVMMKRVNASDKSKNKRAEYSKTEKCRQYRADWARKKYATDSDYRDKVIKSSIATEKRRYERGDIHYKIKQLCRNRIRGAAHGFDRTETTSQLMGCSWEELRHHLESQFQDGMTWENHGIHGWHIDHIVPCATFDLSDPTQQKACFHYTNLQPLWAHENLRWGAKIKV